MTIFTKKKKNNRKIKREIFSFNFVYNKLVNMKFTRWLWRVYIVEEKKGRKRRREEEGKKKKRGCDITGDNSRVEAFVGSVVGARTGLDVRGCATFDIIRDEVHVPSPSPRFFFFPSSSYFFRAFQTFSLPPFIPHFLSHYPSTGLSPQFS